MSKLNREQLNKAAQKAQARDRHDLSGEKKIEYQPAVFVEWVGSTKPIERKQLFSELIRSVNVAMNRWEKAKQRFANEAEKILSGRAITVFDPHVLNGIEQKIASVTDSVDRFSGVVDTTFAGPLVKHIKERTLSGDAELSQVYSERDYGKMKKAFQTLENLSKSARQLVRFNELQDGLGFEVGVLVKRGMMVSELAHKVFTLARHGY